MTSLHTSFASVLCSRLGQGLSESVHQSELMEQKLRPERLLCLCFFLHNNLASVCSMYQCLKVDCLRALFWSLKNSGGYDGDTLTLSQPTHIEVQCKHTHRVTKVFILFAVCVVQPHRWPCSNNVIVRKPTSGGKKLLEAF